MGYASIKAKVMPTYIVSAIQKVRLCMGICRRRPMGIEEGGAEIACNDKIVMDTTYGRNAGAVLIRYRGRRLSAGIITIPVEATVTVSHKSNFKRERCLTNAVMAIEGSTSMIISSHRERATLATT